MKKAVVLAVVLCAVGATLAADGRRAAQAQLEGMSHGVPAVLTFDTMYGVDGPLLGETNAIRGVVGDEAPWTIAHLAIGRLDTSGRLMILVRGLVFGDDPTLVDPSLIGKNDETAFRGLVSCLTEDGQGGIVTANVETDGFKADTLGNSFINQQLTLPNPCVAPIVFVMAGSEEKWFAVTGFESQSGTGSAPRHH